MRNTKHTYEVITSKPWDPRMIATSRNGTEVEGDQLETLLLRIKKLEEQVLVQDSDRSVSSTTIEIESELATVKAKTKFLQEDIDDLVAQDRASAVAAVAVSLLAGYLVSC